MQCDNADLQSEILNYVMLDIEFPDEILCVLVYRLRECVCQQSTKSAYKLFIRLCNLIFSKEPVGLSALNFVISPVFK